MLRVCPSDDRSIVPAGQPTHRPVGSYVLHGDSNQRPIRPPLYDYIGTYTHTGINEDVRLAFSLGHDLLTGDPNRSPRPTTENFGKRLRKHGRLLERQPTFGGLFGLAVSLTRAQRAGSLENGFKLRLFIFIFRSRRSRTNTARAISVGPRLPVFRVRHSTQSRIDGRGWIIQM